MTEPIDCERMEAWLRELNAILDVGDDYDSQLLRHVYDWWQQKDGPRETFNEDGFVGK